MADLNIPDEQKLTLIHPDDFDEAKHKLPIASQPLEAGGAVHIFYQFAHHYATYWKPDFLTPPHGIVMESVGLFEPVRIAARMHDNVVTDILVSMK